MLHQSEQDGGPVRVGPGLPAIKIPEQRLTARTSLCVLLIAPHRPERRVIALDALVVWQNGLQRRENLQPLVALPIAAMCVERPEITTTARVADFCVALGCV